MRRRVKRLLANMLLVVMLIAPMQNCLAETVPTELQKLGALQQSQGRMTEANMDAV